MYYFPIIVLFGKIKCIFHLNLVGLMSACMSKCKYVCIIIQMKYKYK